MVNPMDELADLTIDVDMSFGPVWKRRGKRIDTPRWVAGVGLTDNGMVRVTMVDGRVMLFDGGTWTTQGGV
jgi:hypothetical protein